MLEATRLNLLHNENISNTCNNSRASCYRSTGNSQEKMLEELEIRGRIGSIQTTRFLEISTILRRNEEVLRKIVTKRTIIYKVRKRKLKYLKYNEKRRPGKTDTRKTSKTRGNRAKPT